MRRFFDIAPYAVTPHGRGYALWLDGDLIEDGFPTEGDAYDLLDAAEDETAAQADFGAEQLAEAA